MNTNNADHITQDDEATSAPAGWFINSRDWRGMAGTFAENHFGAPLIHYRGMFYQWIGTHYSAIEDGDIRATAYEYLAGAFTVSQETDENGEAKTVRKRFYPDDRSVNKFLDALRSVVRISGNVKAPCWLPSASPEQCKHNPLELLPCQNGLLDLETGELLTHSASFLGMNAVGYSYDPAAKAPLWDKFVHEVLPDEESRNALQQEIGYLVSNDTSQEKIFAHIGAKRSGKGTIAHTIERLIGTENATHPTLSGLQEHFGLADFIDKRVAIIGDARISGDTSTLVERLLSLSGRDGITIPRKYKDDWTGQLFIRFLINSNEVPRFSDGSAVITDRFILIRFLESFFGREDTKLGDKLARELPGILNWALEGLRVLRRQGRFTQPSNSAELFEMMRFATSPVHKFISDHLQVGKELNDSRDAVYDCYKLWCEKEGHRPMSKTKLDLELNKALPNVVSVGRPGGRSEDRERVYRGIERRNRNVTEQQTATVITLAQRLGAARAH